MDSREFKTSKFLAASDFDSGERKVFTITDADWTTVQDGSEHKDKPAIRFSESDKQLILNATRLKVLQKAFGFNTEAWIGKSVQLFVTDVPFKGELTPSVQIAAVRPPSKPRAAVDRTPAIVPEDDEPPWPDRE